MRYVDMFVAAVPAANKDAYAEHAEFMAGVFKDHGASDVVDAWQDDVPEGRTTSFSMAVKREEGEMIAVGYVVWPDKAIRDTGMKAMEQDERMARFGSMPFDGKRLIYGGFQMIVDI
jgi:uncharacterized protein YbaA (DUF1428 family)